MFGTLGVTMDKNQKLHYIKVKDVISTKKPAIEYVYPII
jgi:uncharacterized membrane protein YcgQ (UPF0703/DUF1980 family)